MPPQRPVILGFHIIMTGYGHWLPNDIRGSGSTGVASERLRELGPVHFGRKAVQPPREELKRFLRNAEQRLDFPVIWFDDAMRRAIGEGVDAAVRRGGYTCYACSVLRNHLHCVIRRHRDDADVICEKISDATMDALRAFRSDLAEHPVWGRDNCKKFKDTIESMWNAVRYVEGNPEKEGLSAQHWRFVTPYDGWPYRQA